MLEYMRVGLLLLLGLLLSPAFASPVITWASDPVRPDETVVLQGGGFDKGAYAEAARLADGPVGLPAASFQASAAGKWERLVALQSSEHSLKFVLPAAWKPGLYACRVRSGGLSSKITILNAPDVWWLQGDQGTSAAPGGWVRIFGKCLNLAGAQIALQQGNKWLTLKPQKADMWTLKAKLPANLTPGEYPVWVHNGNGGAAGWRPAGSLIVAVPVVWKSEVFNVRDFGPETDKAVRAAVDKARENGGGVVYFPRGRYEIKGQLELPPGVALKGEGMGLVSLYWPDLTLDKMPPSLITGTHFGLQDLTLYCMNHHLIVGCQDGSDGVFLRRVRIRANCYFMIERFDKPFRGRQAPTSHTDCAAAIQLRGRNFEVTDCDIYASNQTLHIWQAKVGLIARNRFSYGGRGYTIENTDRLIFEDNTIIGNNLLSIGNDITTFFTNYCRNIYYAHNRLEQMYGADREMMTLDAGGGAYFGHVAEVDGTKLTLAADPTYKNYEPKAHTDWTGAACAILDGTGAGQYRVVTRNEGRAWEVDRPWDIVPDNTSILTIVPHRGRNLFIGNTFVDGGAFQLYGGALDTIIAENQGTRMEGFFAWGLNPHGWGWQPCFNCQFLDNEIIEGNGYGHRTAMIGAFTSNNNEIYAGPLGRALVFRRNVCHNNARLRLGGTLDNVLLEHCTVTHNDMGIDVRLPVRDVLLRDNHFEDVATPLTGDGLPQAVSAPTAKP